MDKTLKIIAITITTTIAVGAWMTSPDMNGVIDWTIMWTLRIGMPALSIVLIRSFLKR